MDISWIASEAKEIHAIFVGIFYLLATILLLIGIVVEYFKVPLGGSPAFTTLIGRALIACILLVAYPDISNAVASVADALAERLGTLNSFHSVLQAAGGSLKDHSFKWTSLGESLLAMVAYASYGILFLSVFFFDAAIVYCTTLLYIFSPILIVFYILPQTAGITASMFRTLFEVATWKIVFCVLGALLWNTVAANLAGQGNFITMLALTLMLAFSLLMTPMVVKNLISGSLSNIASQTAGLAAVALSAGFASPTAIAGLAQASSRRVLKNGTAIAGAGIGIGTAAGWKGTKYLGRKFIEHQREIEVQVGSGSVGNGIT